MNTASNPIIRHPDRLNEIVRTIFMAAGSSDREAALVADHLVEANLKGHDSHGVGIIPAYIDNARTGALTLNQSLCVALDAGSLILCDGRETGCRLILNVRIGTNATLKRGRVKVRFSVLTCPSLPCSG
jgi:LDH2 family malate/lactate/ureidoglycolate dehydrogenase